MCEGQVLSVWVPQAVATNDCGVVFVRLHSTELAWNGRVCAGYNEGALRMHAAVAVAPSCWKAAGVYGVFCPWNIGGLVFLQKASGP